MNRFLVVLMTASTLSVPAMAATPFHEVPYEQDLSGPLANTVALTFDDAPDETGCTDAVLDALERVEAPATFFINTASHTPVADSARARATLKRMLAQGHILGNHTASHLELREQSDTKVRQEIDAVQATINDVLGEQAPMLTLMRAPYGRPFYPHDRLEETDLTNFKRIAAILSESQAVHVGWSIDPCDWNAPSADTLVDRLEKLLDGDETHAPRRGTILLHSNLRVTAEAMPRILDLLKARSIMIVTTEDYVQNSCGAHSYELFGQGTSSRG